MKQFKFIAISLVAMGFVSCNHVNKQQDPEVKTIDTAPSKVVHTSAPMEVEFKDARMAEAYARYIDLKTALVNTNSEATVAASLALLKAYESLPFVAANTLTTARKMAGLEDIDEQRESFVTITADMEIMLKGALKSGTVYKQYCPMAFNNTGAYWLSNSKEINNPYFGDKMLKCGRVASEIE